MMIVKSPLKEKKLKKNRRTNGGSRSNGINGFISGGNGTVYGRRPSAKKQKKLSLPRPSAWKVILCAVVIGALGVLYLSHVFATQQLLEEVQQLEQEYIQAKRHHADYRLTYDRMIGPKEIYQKAKEQGFINGGPADKVIVIEE